MAGNIKCAISVAGILLLALLSAHAQLQVGENTNMNLTGNLGFGYNGDYSNFAGSDHGFNGNGNADLNGYYYSPGFLSFDVQPFYNQSRANSSYQSVFETSGVGATASIFSGSNFPGTVIYSKTYNSQGGYALPELGNITTRGDNQTVGVGWGIHLPDLPKVNFQFTDSGNSNSIFGTNEQSTSHADTFAVNVTHTLAGFSLNGGYQYNTLNGVIPGFLIGEPAQASDSSGSAFNISAGHKLPLNGAFSVGYGRSDISSAYTGGSYNATINTVNGGAGFEPVHNLNVSVNTQYTDNLSGSLYQPIITAGGLVPPALLQYATKSLGISSQATYALPALHLNFMVGADREQQTFLGETIISNALHEMVNYGNFIGGGFLNVTAGVTQTSVDILNSPNTLGFLDSVSYTRRVGGWDLSGTGNYNRNTQTVLIAYTSSGYGYAASIGRRLGRSSHWNATATGAQSNFNVLTGAGNFSQSYSTSLSLSHFSVSGSYAKADGTSILTPTGLTPVLVPVAVLTPTQLFMFGGKSWAAGASTTPVHGLVLSANYAKGTSNTLGTFAASENSTEQLDTELQYKFRQLWFTAGYLRLVQGFSILGGPPASGSSFYVGISRWFKFF
jgi:hypothetical protein